MSEFNNKYAILVTIAESTAMLDECERSLDELERLLNTAGGECFSKIIQIKDKFDPRTCIGKGKVEEIAELCKNNSWLRHSPNLKHRNKRSLDSVCNLRYSCVNGWLL